MNEYKIQRRVQRGLDYLDAKDPEWFLRVNPEKLDLFSEVNCVLGQAYGNFFQYRKNHGHMRLIWGVRHGFIVTVPSLLHGAEYVVIWSAAIRERREAYRLQQAQLRREQALRDARERRENWDRVVRRTARHLPERHLTVVG